MHKPVLLLTCEHAGNVVPPAYQSLFHGMEEVLYTHRAIDPGAWELGALLSERLGAPFLFTRISRLLVECNRSTGTKDLFSEFSRGLPERERTALLEQHYFPYRNEVETQIAAMIAAEKQVVHVDVHSFTPVLNNQVREVEIGFLFDPDRGEELKFCLAWREALERRCDFLVRFNEPYLGTEDGFTTWLRHRFPPESYLGLELEVNQKFILTDYLAWQEVKEAVEGSLAICLNR